MRTFDLALKRTLGFEGGTSNSAIDRGGFTHRGITQKLYDWWRKKHGLALRGVVFVEDAEIVAIAEEVFWTPCRCGEIPPALALVTFDMAFNSGPSDAIVALQAAVGAHQDGDFGPQTLAAVHARGADPDVVLRFLMARGAHIQETIADDPPQLGNLEGWTNRLLTQLDQAWKDRS